MLQQNLQAGAVALTWMVSTIWTGATAPGTPPVQSAPMPLHSRLVPVVTVCLLAIAGPAISGCNKKNQGAPGSKPQIGKKGEEQQAARTLGFPTFATKNTTRVGGADPTADAAGVAQAVFPGTGPQTRPRAVTLVDRENWQGGVAAAVFMSAPLRAPILLSSNGKLPSASRDALATLAPTGSRAAGGAQVVRVGDAATPDGYKATSLVGGDPAALAASIDRLQTRAAGRPSDHVLIVSENAPAFAMPAAAWAAKSGDAVLFVTRDVIPRETIDRLRAHQQPKIYVLGPEATVSDAVLTRLRPLGSVKRIGGATPVRNAIAFAQFIDGRFGWGVVDPGHGLVFANRKRTLDAAAGAPLSATGTYGPLLLVDDPRRLPDPLVQYLLDIQPGFDKDPVRGVYNHGWLLGDESALSVGVQAQIDTLLEIVPVSTQATAPASR